MRRREITRLILASLQDEAKPVARLALPAVLRLVDADGWDPVRQWLFAYKFQDRSWERRLTRAMTIAERIRWRKYFSGRRIEQLEEYRSLKLRGVALRRQLLQWAITRAIEILLGAL